VECATPLVNKWSEYASPPTSSADEATFRTREAVLKQSGTSKASNQQKEAIMLQSILNRIYRIFLETTLAGVARHGTRP
jgi:hypothetical protein